MDARTKRINEAERFLCEVGFADSRNYSASDLAPLMADFSLKSHSWIKITDDPQTLPDFDVDLELWAPDWGRVHFGYYRHSEEWIGRSRPESDEPLPTTNPTHWRLPAPPSES